MPEMPTKEGEGGMTNEELAASLDHIRRLTTRIDGLPSDDVHWFLLRDMDKAIRKLSKATKAALKEAAEAQGAYKIGDHVGYCNVMHTVVAIIPKATLLYVLEKTDADKKRTTGMPVRVAVIVKHDIGKFKWDKAAQEWRLKPSGTASV
jgi:hypothetical protein